MSAESAEAAPFRRWPASLFCALVLAATASPALREPPRDSFPLSDYPMFSTVREADWLSVVTGRDAEGGEHRIPPGKVANAEVMQAAMTIARSVREGRAPALCREVASRLADDPAYAHVVELRVESRLFDPRTYFLSEESGRKPPRVRLHASCKVSP